MIRTFVEFQGLMQFDSFNKINDVFRNKGDQSAVLAGTWALVVRTLMVAHCKPMMPRLPKSLTTSSANCTGSWPAVRRCSGASGGS